MLNQLQKELVVAMKAGEKAKMMGLRNIIGKIKAAQIDKGETLTDEESSKILKTAAKQLEESTDQYQKGGRDDLAEKEALQLEKKLNYFVASGKYWEQVHLFDKVNLQKIDQLWLDCIKN
jgi:hypothetical protein